MSILHSNVLAIDPEQVRNQYCSTYAVDRYASYFLATARHRRKDRREKKCVIRGLNGIKPGAAVLDLPCGAGRMYTTLKDMGYHVVSADSSEPMVDHARQYAETLPNTPISTTILLSLPMFSIRVFPTISLTRSSAIACFITLHRLHHGRPLCANWGASVRGPSWCRFSVPSPPQP